MLAPAAFDGTSEKLFLLSLRETAAGLPLSEEAARLRLNPLIELCARDLGLNTETVHYLLDDLKVLRVQKAIRRTRDQWRSRLAKLGWHFTGRPRVVVLIPDGQSVRSFILTDVCRKLCAWAEVFVLSPLHIGEQIAALGPHAHFLPGPNIRRTRLDTLVGYLGYRQTGSPTNMRFAQRLEENLQKALADDGVLDGSLRVWQIAKGLLSQADYVKAYCWGLRFFSHIHALKDVAALLRRCSPISSSTRASCPGPPGYGHAPPL